MKSKVKLGLNKLSVPELISFSRHILSKMTNNSFFPTPQPELARVTLAADELEKNFNLAQGAGPEQTAAVNQSRKQIETLLGSLGNYVENVANDPIHADAGAESIILSAGMDVRQFTPAKKRTFAVTQNHLPGTVSLVAESVRRGSHEWQYNNPPAELWIDAAPTLQASTTISGLERGKLYSFRHRIIVKEGALSWDDPETIIVV